METLNTKYELQIEVLTPLHVGAGAEKDWVQGSDFIIDNGKVKILNLKKISQFVNNSDLTNALLNKNSEALKAKLAANIDKCVDNTFNVNYSGNNDIKTFIKNGLTNKPIVPGSSIKGAIRSVIAKHLLNGGKTLNEQTLFGKASDGDEFMRFIKVSDAEFEQTNLVNTKIFNLKSTTEGGWKFSGGQQSRTNLNFQNEGFNTFYEVIEPSQKSTMSIALADKAFKNFAEKIVPFSDKKIKIVNENISGLFKIINIHTKSYLAKEKAFFTKYSTDKTDKIIDNINLLINQIPENGKYCILKMAAGSGFHSITGDWQFEDYSIDRVYSEFTDRRTGQVKQKSRGNKKNTIGGFDESAKSRKIAIQGDNFSLMGFIKLTTISEEDKRKMADEQAQKQQAILTQQLEKEAAERKEKERLQKIEDDRIEEENRLRKAESDTYNQAIELNTVDSYDGFIKAFPNSQYKSEIENKLSDLIKKLEIEAFELAKQTNTKESCEQFIS
ncbi:MAG TPA: type III-A CRISPR-associated RAMP protein Csm5, partial [Bacteroidales bacterium]|nr:type III-A CRISPR-associated RAMP protein Csm5 [Bacteroidales bacterium]